MFQIKNNILRYFSYYLGGYIMILLSLGIYSVFATGYFKEYILLQNSVIEFLTIFVIYSIFFIVLKAKKIIYIPFVFIISYIILDLISESYSRYIDYSDFVNIPLLFDALLQSKGDIVYFFIIIPLAIIFFIYKFKIFRLYSISILLVAFLFTWPLPSISLFSNPYIKLYEKFSFSHKDFWSPNKLDYNYAKTGRLSTFFYGGMIKKQKHNATKQYLGDRKGELSHLGKQLEKHIEHRNIYLIGLESFSLPKQLSKLQLQYLNNKENTTYDVIKNASVMITSIFGGGTIQSEFEALCGIPALQQFSAFEFTEFTGAPTNCLPQILKSIGWSTLVSNTYKPQPSFEALRSVGFDDINFPKEYFPSLPSYITNKNKDEQEYAIFDSDLYAQNQEYIKKKYTKENKIVFNYMFSVWGHAFHDMHSQKRPKAIKVLNNKIVSISESSIRALNQEYYRIEALQKYFDKMKKDDPNALIIAFSDHRPVLDGVQSYEKYGLNSDVFHNFIIIMDKGKFIKFEKPFPLYALTDIILNQLTNHWYCKKFQCKIDSNINEREQYLSEYYKIMANAMNLLGKNDFYIEPNNKYYFSNTDIPFVGFSTAEENFRWTNAKSAKIKFKVEKDYHLKNIILNFNTLGEQNISIYLNNHLLANKIVNGTDIKLKLKLDPEIIKKGKVNTLKFILPNAHIPNNNDKRILAIALKSFEFK